MGVKLEVLQGAALTQKVQDKLKDSEEEIKASARHTKSIVELHEEHAAKQKLELTKKQQAFALLPEQDLFSSVYGSQIVESIGTDFTNMQLQNRQTKIMDGLTKKVLSKLII